MSKQVAVKPKVAEVTSKPAAKVSVVSKITDSKTPAIALKPGVVYNLAPSMLRVDKDYNPRRFDPESGDPKRNEDRLFALGIAQRGIETPLTVRQDGPGAPIYIVAGHRRKASVDWLNAKNLVKKHIDSVPVILDESATDEQDRTINLLTSNSGKPLTPIEQAVVVARLIQMGWKPARIAGAAGFTTRYVDILKEMASLPESIGAAVYADVMSATEAQKLVQQAKLQGFDAEDVYAKARASVAARLKYGQPLHVTRKHLDAVLALSGKSIKATPPAPPAPPAPPVVTNAAELAEVARLRAEVERYESEAKVAKPGKESKRATKALSDAKAALVAAEAKAEAAAPAPATPATESRRPAGIVAPGGAAAGKPAAPKTNGTTPPAFRLCANPHQIQYDGARWGKRQSKLAVTTTSPKLSAWLVELMTANVDSLPPLD